jgi:hypothetical protein
VFSKGTQIPVRTALGRKLGGNTMEIIRDSMTVETHVGCLFLALLHDGLGELDKGKYYTHGNFGEQVILVSENLSVMLKHQRGGVI